MVRSCSRAGSRFGARSVGPARYLIVGFLQYTGDMAMKESKWTAKSE